MLGDKVHKSHPGMREQFLMCENQASCTKRPSRLWSNNRNKVSQNSLKQLQLSQLNMYKVHAASAIQSTVDIDISGQQ